MGRHKRERQGQFKYNAPTEDDINQLSFLVPYWEAFRSLPWYEREEINRNVSRHRDSWNHYRMFNGYAKAAICWWNQTRPDKSRSSVKEIVHELMKVIKENNGAIKN